MDIVFVIVVILVGVVVIGGLILLVVWIKGVKDLVVGQFDCEVVFFVIEMVVSYDVVCYVWGGK